MLTILTGISSSSPALNAERIRLEVIAQNIANANTTRGPDGRPYQRQQVLFETVLNQQRSGQMGTAQPTSIQVASIQKDSRPPRVLHAPGHPDADAHGDVAVPNIDIHEEMADLLTASRAFEANLAVIKNSKALALQALSIGKK
jgi:flagellar basal-body rod protein FlgC